MRSRPAVPTRFVFTAILGTLLCPCARAAVPPASTRTMPAIQPFAVAPTPDDAGTTHPARGFAVRPEYAAAAGVALLTISDHAVWQQATGAGGAGAQRLSDLVQPLGTPTALAPPLVAGVLAGQVFGRPELTHASLRIAGSLAAAGLTTEALKSVVGRSRPYQVLNGDPDDTRMFSGNRSFPSGHTTMAFAAATALDRETDSRWVPWIAYPVAGLVGWSRIHDEKHWMSDVAAGAAVGYFVANHAENYLRSNPGFPRHLLLGFDGHRGLTAGANIRF